MRVFLIVVIVLAFDHFHIPHPEGVLSALGVAGVLMAFLQDINELRAKKP